MIIDELIANLRHPDFTTRCDAARELGKSRDPRAVDALVSDLADRDWRIRRNAAQALGATKLKQAVEPLLDALKDRVMTVRLRAVVGLGRIKDERSLPGLVNAFFNDEGQVAEAAYQALLKFKKKAAPFIVDGLASASEARRGYALHLLAELKAPEALYGLWLMTQDPDPARRSQAYEALSELPFTEAVDMLLEGTNDPEGFAKIIAIRGLGKHKDARILPRLLALLVGTDLFGLQGETYRAVAGAVHQMAGLPADLGGVIRHDLVSMIGTLDEESRLDLSLMASQLSIEYKEWMNILQDGSEPPIPQKNKGLDLLQQLFSAGNTASGRIDRLLHLLQAPDALTRTAAALSLPWYQDARALPGLGSASQGEVDVHARLAMDWAYASLNEATSIHPRN